MSTSPSREVGTKEAARLLGVHIRTLAAWREAGVGPPWRQVEAEGPERRTAPLMYRVDDIYAYLRGDLYWDDPEHPEWEREPELSPLSLESLPWGSEVSATFGGRTVYLLKRGHMGLPWWEPETNELLTTYRAAQLGFTPLEGITP